jgi:hypothetical protein
MASMKSSRLSLPQALMWIIGSALVINAAAYNGLKFYLKSQRSKAHDRQYAITSIVQTGPQKEALTTDYLAELMGLSVDRPTSSVFFDVKQAEKKLMCSPLIKQAHVKVVPPSGLYVDYSVRQPIAWLYDFENTAIDQEGYLFPVYPFLTSKILPELYFGTAPFGQAAGERPSALWGQPIRGKYVEIAFSILHMLSTLTDSTHTEDESYSVYVRRIDLADAFADSYGERQIVVKLEDLVILSKEGRSVSFILPRLLRLSTKNYAQELGNFLTLREGLLEQEKAQLSWPEEGVEQVTLTAKVIDLRLLGLAFIQ